MGGPSPNVHDEAWEAIARSPLLAIYVHELHWLASDVVRRADSIFEQTPQPEPGGDYIKADAALHSEIYAMLGDAVKIRALVTDRPKRRDQSTAEFEILVRRARALRDLLSGLDLATICSADARHSVEHFDERIDRAALGAYEDTIPKPVNIPLDLAVWSRAAFEVLKGAETPRPTIYPLRVYIASERVFVNGEAAIDIGKLWDECAAVVDRLVPMLPEDVVAERGAFVVRITASSLSIPAAE